MKINVYLFLISSAGGAEGLLGADVLVSSACHHVGETVPVLALNWSKMFWSKLNPSLRQSVPTYSCQVEPEGPPAAVHVGACVETSLVWTHSSQWAWQFFLPPELLLLRAPPSCALLRVDLQVDTREMSVSWQHLVELVGILVLPCITK